MKTVADGQSLPTGENSGPAFDIYQNRDIRHPNRLCSSTEVNGVSPEDRKRAAADHELGVGTRNHECIRRVPQVRRGIYLLTLC